MNMMDVLLTCVDSSCFVPVFIFVFTFWFVSYTTRRPANVPPGPPLWPIIGNLLSLGTQPLVSLRTLRGKYGDVIGLYIGSELNVFVNGYPAVHEVLVKKGNVFSKRPETYHTEIEMQPTYIVYSNGSIWKEHRNFALRTLHHLCISNRSMSMEDRASEELRFLVEKLAICPGPIDLKRELNLSLVNIMFSIVFGKRLDYDNEDFSWYMDLLDKTFKKMMRRKLLIECFPWLQYLPIDVIKLTFRRDNEKKMIMFKKFLKKLRDKNTKAYVNGSEECLIHCYMTAMKDSSFLSEEGMWFVMHELIAAGSETVATTLHWILLYLVRNPEMQTKLHAEIDEKIGKKESPSLCHRQKMTYTEAVILEGLRIGHAVPFAIPHCTKKDTTVNGCFIPENTTVMVNLQSVMKDSEVFRDPEVFCPERFLDESGTKVKTFKELIPFSLGPRSCLGESLARINLFMYLTTLLQKFEFRVPVNGEKPSTSGILGITYAPLPFKVDIINRV